ncbi:MAG: hypothetical protein AAGB22_03190, partial [Bacteroidota bacterium]
NESIAVFKLYQEAYANDFNEAMRLKKDKENSYEAMERYFKAQEKAERKLSQASERFEKAQRQFAEKHGMVLQEDDAASGLLTRIAAVNRYSRRVFLAYFRVAKADAAFMQGVEERKTGQLDKQRQQLENATEQVLSELDTVQPFRGNTAFRDATKKLVQFYHDLAVKDYPTLGAVMRKKPDEMTATDAENYNDIVQRYNATNVELVTAFNRENVALLQQHIPSQ